ncbi:ATP-dependent RecD-like DNA helicase [Faecalicatena orotica]|uniref:ATP-dependent exoDNAse (Exonuclease V) alpha subunit n=1 Tax=Faecalicatena orotica TaxID=1544 RepID=A0A2Y9BDL6_9FIRM|nr:AAA family ATPase [Faecalicatena orotica]PWJ31195.1 ATP-dependent exoDNAse (exonuclease V) alpha subunit [Faecalicatena orotica]SSA54401.1 ATP-dependent exoDNAse (exonuclease V), alpha subunit, helicase superfamily I [Faecalicatena orotica]
MLDWKKRELIQSHIATHTQRSAEDQAAVSTLEYFLRSDGRINTDFSSVDKWPNHDGTFEFVSNPNIIRCPKQSFSVQIKGTHNFIEKEGVISYSLKSLSYPAYIANNVTADPGILFVVINPDVRGAERIYWRYLSTSIINDIDFNKDSYTIKFCQEDEIRNTDESINEFCEKLDQIIETHLFLQKLCKESLKKEEALEMINYRCQEISTDIELVSGNHELRDYVSRRIVTGLYDLCYAAMILNAVKLGYTDINEQLAWEVSQFKIETKYLSNFLKGLKYIAHRIPKEGQSERLMLKYYSYLWEIRRFLKRDFLIDVLENLEKFPLDLDTLDTEYYETVAECIENTDLTPRNVRVSRYYVQKKVPFFVDGERYFEITLQLAGLYSTKYNRITVYSKKNISTNYSIQIAYSETGIELWGIKNKIKILNEWKVAIDPTCLNKLAKMLKIHTKINRNYGEYINLMRFLTETGMNLLEIINLNESQFYEIYNYVYGSTNTHDFGNVLLQLRNNYSKTSCKIGKNTVSYCLLSMREEILEDLFPNQYNSKSLSGELYIRSKCYPFEKNPFISNLVGRKTSRDINSLLEIVDNSEKAALVQPYLKIEQLISETGELYFDKKLIASKEAIEKYNASLDSWERREGLLITEKEGLVSIESYEITTLFILRKLLGMSHDTNREQQKSNDRYLRECGFKFEDPLKKVALKNLFVYSKVILIYGAAGTGKTTLINYISDMMNQSRKLYLTKTHTALQNLQRRVKNISENCAFSIIDSITRSNSLVDYDIVFVDECSTIDNRTMKSLLEKIDKGTMLVLSGDIYQIESIDFGNWFYYAKDIIKVKGASVELINTWRTDKEELKKLWNEIREKKPIITEKLSMEGPFSEDLGENIFKREAEEVVLCLNYDGKFGLNNMNQYFQNDNLQSEAVSWAEWTFKIGDPIVFLDVKRSPLLYNNLRGTIVDIMKEESKIVFTIDIKTFLTREQCEYEEFEYILNNENETRILLDVIAWDDELPEEDRIKTVIPFQIAYAISIHKAQGLEYKSVKVVIPSSNAEKITHSIFYTAITRAKEKLKIFWSAETMEAIVKSFTIENIEQNTLQIIKEKLGVDNE